MPRRYVGAYRRGRQNQLSATEEQRFVPIQSGSYLTAAAGLNLGPIHQDGLNERSPWSPIHKRKDPTKVLPE